MEGDTVSKVVSLRAMDGQVEASAEGRQLQSSPITFDKDNPVGIVPSGAAERIASS